MSNYHAHSTEAVATQPVTRGVRNESDAIVLLIAVAAVGLGLGHYTGLLPTWAEHWCSVVSLLTLGALG